MRSDSDTARALLYSIRCGLSGLLIGVVSLFSASASTSDGMASIDAREQQRQQERERALQQQMPHRPMRAFPVPTLCCPITQPMNALASSSIG